MKINGISHYIYVTAFILLIPFIAMQFTDEIDWSLADFIIAGTLLLAAGIIFELITSRVDTRHRFVIAAFVFVIVLAIWAELAVGIFESPFAGS